MELIHWSKEPLTTLVNKEQSLVGMMKPNGLWVSDESSNLSWFEWCTEIQHNLDHLKYKTTINLLMNDILWLNTSDKICALFNEYSDWFGNILWHKIAQQYKGIIISPYHRKLRTDRPMTWYYSWDCASGCIWDVSAIASYTTTLTQPIKQG